MATGWPMKTTYANGDVYSASDVNDITGTINLLGSSVAYTAGKNKIINGDFGIWQRGTSFTNPAPSAYLADRFSIDYNTGTVNCAVSRQTFSPGTAPVSGYESSYFLRVSQSAATASKFIYFGQNIEDVRTFAGQTVTFSFWAKANATKTLKSRSVQIFGSGGSGAVATSEISNTITTSWARYSNTISVPSISGKTIGTNSYIKFDLNWDSNAIQDIDLWGFQVESGSTATAFQTATGTIQGELAACQRYYEKSITQASTPGGTNTGEMWFPNGTIANGETWQLVRFSVTKRTSPTVTTYSYSGTSGRAANDSGTNYGADSANVWRNGDSYAVIKNNSGSSMTVTSVRWVYCNWTADAEL